MGLQSDEALGVNRLRDISFSGWKLIGGKVLKRVGTDHVTIVSAGVAFFFFLAVFPAIAAGISIYSWVQDPQVIREQVASLSALLPDQAYELIETALRRKMDEVPGTLGWSAAVAILLAIWSSKKGMNSVFQGINVAYKQTDRRGFIRNNLLTLAFTFASLIFGLLVLSLLALFPVLTEAFSIDGWWLSLASAVRWLVLVLLILLALAFVYRVAPAREAPRFRWITAGAAVAGVLWLSGSFAFSWYANNFGRFTEIYGSFAAVVILMLWFYLTAFSILLGAQINAEVEQQSNRETD